MGQHEATTTSRDKNMKQQHETANNNYSKAAVSNEATVVIPPWKNKRIATQGIHERQQKPGNHDCGQWRVFPDVGLVVLPGQDVTIPNHGHADGPGTVLNVLPVRQLGIPLLP